MPGGAKLLLLLVTFLGLGMGLHQDLGLQRALTPKPQHILAANRSAVPAMLNQVLLEHHRLTFTPCADWSLSDLASLYATLLPLTSPELASIYEAKSDRRRMRHTSMVVVRAATRSLDERWRETHRRHAHEVHVRVGRE